MKAIRNFAIIAAMASFVVACGGKKDEATEATTDSAATEMTTEPAPADTMPADTTVKTEATATPEEAPKAEEKK
jgi:hypothetical protein